MLALTASPYLYGALTCPPGQRFLGLVGQNGHDQAFYLAWGARQAENGHLLFEDKYNGHAERRAVLNPLWLAMGWAARLTGLTVLSIFHLERVLFSALLLLAAYGWIARFVSGSGWRLLALGMLATTSGLGSLLVPLAEWGGGRGHQAVAAGWVTPDLWIVESNVFLTMLWEVVLPCATWLFLLALHAGYRTFFDAGGSALRLGALTLLLGSVYPYAVVSVWFILGGAALFQVTRGRDRARTLREYATLLVVSLPVVLYDGYLVWSDPRLTTGQAQYTSPGPLLYVVGLGVIALLAPLGAAFGRARGEGRRAFLFVWVSVTGLQIYLPITLVPFQMQLVLGLQVPLAILASQGLAAAWEALRRSPRLGPRAPAVGAAGLAVVLTLSSVTSAYHLVRVFGQLQKRALPDYIDADLERAIDWLSRHSHESEVVLASPEVAPYIPLLAHNRVYMGDYPAPTAFFAEKLARVRRLLGGAAPQPRDTLARALAAERIDVLFYDLGLQTLGGPAAREAVDSAPGLERVFENSAARIYRVAPVTRR